MIQRRQCEDCGGQLHFDTGITTQVGSQLFSFSRCAKCGATYLMEADPPYLLTRVPDDDD